VGPDLNWKTVHYLQTYAVNLGSYISQELIETIYRLDADLTPVKYTILESRSGPFTRQPFQIKADKARKRNKRRQQKLKLRNAAAKLWKL
jgi:hypothetical protein